MSPNEKSQKSARRVFVDAYMDAIPLIQINLIWALLTLPVVTAAPAAAGLFYATNRLAHDNVAGWRTVLRGFRRHFWLSWRWAGSNVLIIALLVSSILFYSRQEAGWAVWALIITQTMLLTWLALQLYTFPLLLEQEEPRLRTAWRNSAIVYFRRPLSSVGLALAMILIAFVSTLWLQPAWLFISGSLCAYLANRGTVLSIEALQG